MSKVYCIRTRQKGKHLTYPEREELEAIVNFNNRAPKRKRLSQRKIAERMGVSPATISRELKRGRVILRDSEFREVVAYSAMVAQDDYDQKASAKGPHLKIGSNHELVMKLEENIITGKCSPYAAIERVKNSSCYKKTPISERTLYNYIDLNILGNVTKKDLPRRGKSSKRKYRRVAKRIRDVNAKPIDNRPKEADQRSEFGHWEMDCIESGRKKARACLLVLVERKNRQTLIFKMASQTQKEVQHRFDLLEKKMGFRRFRKVFKSITVDNGSEFLDWRNIEKSCISIKDKPRTQIYYCHPYHSWERGTNEQINGHIRRFIPKGSALSDYNKKDISELQDWLNNYPRKILDGKCANDLTMRDLRTIG